MSSKEVMKLADVSMYDSAAMPDDAYDESGLIRPRVHLLSATPDPLGSIAAAELLYAGKPVYDLSEITNEQRRWAWEECQKSHLKAPQEFVDFHFMIEAVTRSFTHQMVRQRTAVYAQESLRFAMKKNLVSEAALPPTVADSDTAQAVWDKTIDQIEQAYHALISAGIPAEDARGLLPHATTTRLHYKTNLRNLLEHAGNRLCTQAQFEWRYVFIGIMRAISDYKGPRAKMPDLRHRGRVLIDPNESYGVDWPFAWQFRLIGEPRPETFAPVCYHLNKCPFMGDLDRFCVIRERVEHFASRGIPSHEWGTHEGSDRINVFEWMSMDSAARRPREANEPHSHDPSTPCYPACPRWEGQ